MSDGNWIAIIGIIVSIILSRIDSRSNSIKTRKSNDLTRQSIQEEHKYNRLLANNNINILKQRRSEEAMIAINRFNTRIWPIFNHLRNTMKHRSLNKTEIKSLTHVI